MTDPESLSLRRRLALEIGRKLYQQKVKEHPCANSSGSVPCAATCIAAIAEATAR